jgi:hypothetical protein
MAKRASIVFVLCLISTSGFAKDKNKNLLPAYVLEAHTVVVIIEPGAGMSIEDPRANQVAQKDVETALLNWGRFETTLATQAADLIIVIRKGNGRLVNETLPDSRQNNRAGVITPIDNGIGIGAQQGPRPPDPSSRLPQSEIGETEDSFVVYKGSGLIGEDRPLDTPPAYRYLGRDGLHPGTVPAVSAFRKAIADAEKAAAKKP